VATSYVTLNGIAVPAPDKGLDVQIVTTVNAARNEDNVFVGQKVGRDQQKLDGWQWGVLTAAQWAQILQICDNFVITVSYADPKQNARVTRQMYVGDRKATVLRVDRATGMPTYYFNCSVNFIDTGEGA